MCWHRRSAQLWRAERAPPQLWIDAVLDTLDEALLEVGSPKPAVNRDLRIGSALQCPGHCLKQETTVTKRTLPQRGPSLPRPDPRRTGDREGTRGGNLDIGEPTRP